MCQHARMGDTMIQEAAPLKIWVEVIPTLCFTYAITAVTSEFWIIGEHKDADSAAITEVLVMANIPEMACMKIIGGQGCVWVRSFEWIQGGFLHNGKSMKKNYYFCWCVEFPKGLVHTPIQIPSKNDVLTMISSPLGYKIPQLSPTGSLINLPRLGCTILRLKKGRQTFNPFLRDLWDKPHKHPSCNQDIFRWFPKYNKILRQVLMIIGWWSWATSLPKTHPLPKKVLQVAPKKNCHACSALSPLGSHSFAQPLGNNSS